MPYGILKLPECHCACISKASMLCCACISRASIQVTRAWLLGPGPHSRPHSTYVHTILGICMGRNSYFFLKKDTNTSIMALRRKNHAQTSASGATEALVAAVVAPVAAVEARVWQVCLAQSYAAFSMLRSCPATCLLVAASV